MHWFVLKERDDWSVPESFERDVVVAQIVLCENGFVHIWR